MMGSVLIKDQKIHISAATDFTVHQFYYTAVYKYFYHRY